jgi:hypothetical protein
MAPFKPSWASLMTSRSPQWVRLICAYFLVAISGDFFVAIDRRLGGHPLLDCPVP